MMDREIIIPISPSANNGKKSGVWTRAFLREKLNNPVGYMLLGLLFAGVAVGVGLYGIKFGLLTLIGAMVVPILYIMIVFPMVGLSFFIVMAYFLIYFVKLGVDFPVGTIMDGMEAIFLLGLFIQQRKKKDWSVFRSPITNIIFIWIAYNFIQYVNPYSPSRMAWLYTVRSVALVMVMYFIFLYNIRTIQSVRWILKLWLGLALLAALYAFMQQYIGFTSFEWAYLHSDTGLADLLFIGGVWRKFSFFSDPVVFAYTMVVSSLLCVGLLTGPVSKRNRWILRALIVVYLDAMLFSGTRGAYVLVPAALILYAILKFNKRILLMGVVGGFFFLILVFIPTSNNTLYRFQTAFKPSNDASYNLRKKNQHAIQPFVKAYPMGGGLGSTGIWGLKFAPDSYLAHFPPDSGYVRVAVEMGWVGLLLICILMFVVLKTGIDNYYKIRDPELKSYMLAMIMIVFAFHVGNYPQEALVQFPSNVNFYLVIALINVLMRLEIQKQNQLIHAGGK